MMERRRVLVVDDEVEVTSFFKYLLEGKNDQVTLANSGKEVNHILTETYPPFHLALVDLKLPDANGLDLMNQIKRKYPTCEVIIMTGFSTIQSAITAIQQGAKDYLEKPFDDLDALERVIDSVLDSYTGMEGGVRSEAAQYGIICAASSPMSPLLSIAQKLAKKNINILIEGDTGTGKELMSRFIHGTSLRSQYPFVGVNCGAIPDALLESELFGHEKGAFTGAIKTRKGFFELAHNGTLFLDEIGEAPHSIQVKLLRAIETGEFMRVGSENTLVSNIRFIAATNRNLEEEVGKKRFRQDLLYRLEGVKLQLPPIRERSEDIPLICANYLEKKYSGKYSIAQDALDILKQYEWPGNVRQLINVINQIIAIHDGKIIQAHHLPQTLRRENLAHLRSLSSSAAIDSWLDREIDQFVEKIIIQISSDEPLPFRQIMDKLKKIEIKAGKRMIRKGLLEADGDRKLLCKKLKITDRMLRYVLNEKN